MLRTPFGLTLSDEGSAVRVVRAGDKQQILRRFATQDDITSVCLKVYLRRLRVVIACSQSLSRELSGG